MTIVPVTAPRAVSSRPGPALWASVAFLAVLASLAVAQGPTRTHGVLIIAAVVVFAMAARHYRRHAVSRRD